MADTNNPQDQRSNAMDPDKQKDVAGQGKDSQGREDNSSNFSEQDEEFVTESGSKGGQAAPDNGEASGLTDEDLIQDGRNSQRSDDTSALTDEQRKTRDEDMGESK